MSRRESRLAVAKEVGDESVGWVINSPGRVEGLSILFFELFDVIDKEFDEVGYEFVGKSRHHREDAFDVGPFVDRDAGRYFVSVCADRGVIIRVAEDEGDVGGWSEEARCFFGYFFWHGWVRLSQVHRQGVE